ncbi:penicillin-binding protein activator [Burkholderiaceae bacterium FT117]|uniref:penicillin-binding protein activator n=1 Tax=Zeimonas sediminis TaxID=2944268 RepID=UPI002342E32C|nr:penicillin-binding protein activator [Zeimonas sediminis]MCM5570989.1 penicillin-binding protein activator [Zeimonas sediminis]
MTHRLVSRRRSLRSIARAAAAAVAASALPAFAQEAANGGVAATFGTPSEQRERIGAGPSRIALLVPPANGVYRRAALALTDGVRAAHSRDGAGFAVEVIETTESGPELRGLCDRLAARGFQLAIGPLTRNAVTALAATGPLPLPVLALNQTDGVAPPPNMALFGLSIENEAEQVASYAYRDAASFQTARRPRAAIVHDGSPLSQRSVGAFIERWYQSGGEYYEAVETDMASASISTLRSALRGVDADVWFAAMPPSRVPTLRGAIGERAFVYGTSVLNSGATPEMGDRDPKAPVIRSPELDGVRLVVMPWQVQPDHPAVMAYPRQRELNVELQKVYALGIDALRLGQVLMAGETHADIDGVTGLLRLDLARDARVDRLPLLAEYRDGVLGIAAPR